jgi:RNA polymerase-binding transcription factor DksA
MTMTSRAFAHAEQLLPASRRALRMRLERDRESREAQLRVIEEDRVQATEDLVAFVLRRSVSEALAATERALQRLDDGTYGLCLRCHDSIPLRRLESLPHTPFCVRCS